MYHCFWRLTEFCLYVYWVLFICILSFVYMYIKRQKQWYMRYWDMMYLVCCPCGKFDRNPRNPIHISNSADAVYIRNPHSRVYLQLERALYGSFHWKCYTPKIHQIQKLKFLVTNSNGRAAVMRTEAAASHQGRPQRMRAKFQGFVQLNILGFIQQ